MLIHKVKKSSGFTLVELLVVVIILAVLASIVVPQFSSSTDDAKVAALDSTLTNLRGAIELYYHQHGSVYPGKNGDGGGNSADSAGAFISQLTKYTESDGTVNNKKTSSAKYGPYLRTQTFPANPIDNLSTITIITDGDLNATVGASPVGGWWFDTNSGKLMSNEASYSDH